MATRPSIDDLCARYHNEDVHTEHVTGLARQLFDACAAPLKLKPSDRDLLAAAARLHDLGYSRAPRNHPEIGAQLVIRHGLSGFRPPQAQRIAAIILFHSGDWRATLDHPLVTKLNDRARIARLGAILRVADGLDHGHIQDAVIHRVEVGAEAVQVSVASPWFPDNLMRAETKADLWNARCPLPIEFHAAPDDLAPHPALVDPDVPLAENARRLLSLQFKTITINVTGALTAENDEPLHEIRVALRRFRVLLRFFGKQLPPVTAKRLYHDLGRLSDGLSAARDHDVWLAFLDSDEVGAAVGRNRLWEPFLQYQRSLRELDRATIQRHLRGRPFAALRQRIDRWLRVTLPRCARESQTEPALPRLVKKRFQKAVKQIEQQAHLRRSDDPAALHRLRVTMRRARYLGDFFGAQLSKKQRKLASRLKRLDQTLGRVHDADEHLARITREGPTPPRALVALLRGQRADDLRAVRKQWKHLQL